MVEKITWSAESLDDIDAIAEFIARDSEHHAMRVVDQILATGEAIADQPSSGREVPEVQNDHIRAKFIYSYRLIYHIAPNTILIIAVIHGKRLLDAMDDRLEQ